MTIATVTTSSLWWSVARSGGLLGWAMLAASVIWGLVLSTKVLGRKPRPAWVLDLHRFLGGLALIFTAIHVLGIYMDSYVHFGLSELFVPLATTWHPLAVAWGIVGMYLLAAVELTSLLRKKLPRTLWRRTHYLSFPLFVSATVHGLAAGTDTAGSIIRWTTLAIVAMVAGLIGLRIAQATEDTPEPATPRIPRVPPRAREAVRDEQLTGGTR